jgi:hypothetical protein
MADRFDPAWGIYCDGEPHSDWCPSRHDLPRVSPGRKEASP